MNPIYGVVQSSPARLAVLESIVRRVQADHIEVLEVGSYEGSSALNFSNSIALLKKTGRILCVDPWVAYLPEEDIELNPTCARMQEELKLGTVFERFAYNIKNFTNQQAPIQYFRGTLWQMIEAHHEHDTPPFDKLEFDIVYVDGSHIYEDVKRDFELVWPMLKNGGFLCGDDLEKQLTDFPSWAHVACVADREYVSGYHPGVTLAVGERFGRVWSSSGAWAVQKHAEDRWSVSL